MTQESIGRCLKTVCFGRSLHVFETLGSTNDEARRLASSGAPEGTVVAALAQTAGRGRENRRWISEPGKNLTFTLILRPPIAPGSLGLISLYTSAAVAECVASLAGKPAGCKWPNDVVVSGRKIAGILCESSLSGGTVSHAVVGIGLNVNQRDFPPEIAGRSTSLLNETGVPADLSAVLCALLGRLEAHYRPADAGWGEAVIAEWTGRNVILGSRVEVAGGAGRLSGVALSVTPAGALVIDTGNGTVEVTAGDVHLL